MRAPQHAAGDEHRAHNDDAALDQALQQVPRGALALSGLTVGLLLLAWLLMYALVFLPRGMVS
jgi:hypothetical protein